MKIEFGREGVIKIERERGREIVIEMEVER